MVRQDYLRFLDRLPDSSMLYEGSFDPALVILSVAIAVFASYAALDVAGRVAAVKGRMATVGWLAFGSVAMGAGIWSMHFIGMLSFSLPCLVTYDPALTLASMVPGILASAVALHVISHPTVMARQLAWGGLLLGGGIGTMHYSGMAAMRMDALLRYDPVLFGVSILVAVILAVIALRMKFAHDSWPPPLRRLAPLGSALVMGAAVSGMHYTAMAAAFFIRVGDPTSDATAVQPFFLAMAVTAVVGLLTALVLVASFAHRHLEISARLREEIAERRRAEADLARSNADLEQFAYAASHDLQEPLRTITRYVQLLERRMGANADADTREFMGFVQDGAKRMSAQIKDLLDYSRIGSRGQDMARVDCGEMISEIRRDLAAGIEECGAKLIVHSLPSVQADRHQLIRVLQNLIANAIRYRQPGRAPRIEVSASAVEDEWVFSVADNGIGIDPQYFDRIFIIFQRLHTKHEYGGTGIGLALCKRIIERHGGHIWLTSTPGEGSTFYFSLPRESGSG